MERDPWERRCAAFLFLDGAVALVIALALAWGSQGVSLVLLGPVAAVILWAAVVVWRGE